MGNSTKIEEGALPKDVLNYITQFLSPYDAVAFTRTCRFVHNSVDLKAANWRPYMEDIIRQLENNGRIDDSRRFEGLIEIFADKRQEISQLPKTRKNLLCASLVQHGEELKDYYEQLQSTGKHRAGFCFWLGNIAKSVCSAIGGKFSVIKPGVALGQGLWCAMFISKDKLVKLGLTNSHPYIFNFYYYTVPALFVVNLIRESYSRYQSLIADNQTNAAQQLPDLLAGLRQVLEEGSREDVVDENPGPRIFDT